MLPKPKLPLIPEVDKLKPPDRTLPNKPCFVYCVHYPSKIYISDWEGPKSMDDMGKQVTDWVVGNELLYNFLSSYDDYLAYLKKFKFKVGGENRQYTVAMTLGPLTLPVLKAYDCTEETIRDLSRKEGSLLPGAKKTISYVQKIAPLAVVSASWKPYLEFMMPQVNVPLENVYWTECPLDKVVLSNKNAKIIRDGTKELLSLIESSPKNSQNLSDIYGSGENNMVKYRSMISDESMKLIEKADSLIWDKFYNIKECEPLFGVVPNGGPLKAQAISDFVEKLNKNWDYKYTLEDVWWIFDSITDMESADLVRNGGGAAVSFNGKEHPIAHAEFGVASLNTLVQAVMFDIYNSSGIDALRKFTAKMNEGVYNPGKNKQILIDNLKLEIDSGRLHQSIYESYKATFYEYEPAKIVHIPSLDKEGLSTFLHESKTCRKNARGVRFADLS